MTDEEYEESEESSSLYGVLMRGASEKGPRRRRCRDWAKGDTEARCHRCKDWERDDNEPGCPRCGRLKKENHELAAMNRILSSQMDALDVRHKEAKDKLHRVQTTCWETLNTERLTLQKQGEHLERRLNYLRGREEQS
jgi:hypothetical protein